MINFIITIALAALRIGGVKHEAFQAVAHLYVGGLYTAGYVIYNRIKVRPLWGNLTALFREDWFRYYFFAIFLTIVEIVVAFPLILAAIRRVFGRP